MYGLINEAVRQLVCSEAGTESWQAMCQKIGIESEGFEPLNPYPDSVTYELIHHASEVLRLPVHQVLRQFGHYWITYTAEQGYGGIMLLFGKDFRTCLANLNRMHAHMGAMMPDLSPPRFTLESADETHITLHYFSHRLGLGSMVVGLLEGLAEKYAETVTIQHIPAGARSDHDEYDMTFASQ